MGRINRHIQDMDAVQPMDHPALAAVPPLSPFLAVAFMAYQVHRYPTVCHLIFMLPRATRLDKARGLPV